MTAVENGISSLYITHYYPAGSDPWKNILALPEAEAFRTAELLAASHPGETGFFRFADFRNYYPQRKAADAYLREAFLALGGRPVLEHPFSFVLLESEYLRRWFGSCEVLRIGLGPIPDDRISFTVGDSCAQIERGLRPEVFTKGTLLRRIREHEDNPYQYLESVLTQFSYVEAQLWMKMEL